MQSASHSQLLRHVETGPATTPVVRQGLTRRLNALLLTTLVLFLSAAIISGCGPKKDGKRKETVVPVPQNSFVREWTQSTELEGEGNSLTRLYLSDTNLYAITSGFESYVLTRAGGSLQGIHVVDATGGVLREPVILQDKVVYPTGTTLEVYDLQGQRLRSIGLQYPTRSRGLGSGNMVYIGIDYPQYGRLAAIDVTRDYGVTRWELQTRGAVSAKPAMFDNVLFIGSEDGRVYAVDVDRNPIWPLEGSVFVTGGRITADLKADDFGVYVASGDSKLYCIDRNTGRTKWQYFAGNALAVSPIVTADSVYQYVEGEGVVAIDKTAGKFNREVRWKVEDASQFLSADDKYVYLRKRGNRIIAVDKATGEEKFASEGRDFDLFVSNQKDNIIYAAKKSGLVVAIKPVLVPGTVGEIVKFETEELDVFASAH